ncbi:UDP-N-acetylglucosamine 2-epimerase [Thalassotalea profundi]|uniref:UDP-N-acetyl glucosamine 2-epimerase n=1 Tax=Thalassotalea profundi TaxID=2036687 RepID=A0ABQ3IDZ8_9GAMM|nr:UDP-N-acetylglucosamine 2-epimerase [Thalassotalea profundi]GHE80959.1 UDP-N-acetyl glucosamine 2-epimerase [Thalassotalea profundi]
MKKIAVFTGTRAEYGLLTLLLKGLQASDEVELQLFVGGTHLIAEFGYTVEHIIHDGFDITERLDYLLPADTPLAVNQSMAKAQMLAGECFVKHQPDLLILLGDRFEALAVAQAATICGVPIAHIHGGELTEGAMDEVFRHALTKLSHWHFTSTEVYRQRVIQLGEQPNTVVNVGAPGIDNIKQLPLLNLKELEQNLAIKLNKPYFLITYHPETLSTENPVDAIANLFTALDKFPKYNMIITYPNADAKGRIIMTALESYTKAQPERIFLFRSIGQLNYLSAMKHCAAVIGNSSSGIIETPSFNIPTINIGDRQKGRIASDSVIQCGNCFGEIYNSITQALSPEFRQRIAHIDNPYGNGNACEKMLTYIVNTPLPKTIKRFYDLKPLSV